jgi:hypothetical protein
MASASPAITSTLQRAVLQLPLIILLEQHGADRPLNCSFIGEDLDEIGAAFDLLLEPFE